MQWVLDLDMDFFVRGLYGPAAEGQRPQAPPEVAWDEGRLRAFLEGSLGLSRQRPTPGCLVRTHDGSLRLWQRLLEEGRLRAPFAVTHVDAHADLGIGKPGPAYVLEQVLALKPQVRPRLDRYDRLCQLDEANYLLFALAFRWVGRLQYLHTPDSRPDVPAAIDAGDFLRLGSDLSRMMEAWNGPEPAIPFQRLDGWAGFQAPASYEFVSVAHSPRYLPACADGLLELVRAYVAPL